MDKIRLNTGITANITDLCNMKCAPCSDSTTKEGKKAVFMNLELLNKILNVTDIGDEELIISGGEATLHPDFSINWFRNASESYERPLICTNASTYTRIYEGPASFANPSFRRAVDVTLGKLDGVAIEGKPPIKISASLNEYLPIEDIAPHTLNAILIHHNMKIKDLKNMLKRDDLYQRLESEEADPIIEVMKGSRLYKRAQVLMAADAELRGEYGWSQDEQERIIYFVTVGSGTDVETIEKNVNAVTKIFSAVGFPRRDAGLMRYGHAHDWPNAITPTQSNAIKLELRAACNGNILAYTNKYDEREDARLASEGSTKGDEHCVGVISCLDDYFRLIDANPVFTSSDTCYVRKIVD